MKSHVGVFLMILLICSIALICNTSYSDGQGEGQQFRNVSGTINEDVVWTKEYFLNFTTSVIVAKGATLTIEAGVVAKLNFQSITVEGTLIAKGTCNSPISFYDGGTIIFDQYSSDWNAQTGTGSIIENTLNFYLIINDASPRISQDKLSVKINGGSPIISNNDIGGVIIYGGSPLISNNTISKTIITGHSNLEGSVVAVYGGSPVILNNTIASASELNLKYGIAIGGEDTVVISDNVINQINGTGIYITSGSPTIQRNFISSGYSSGIGLAITGNSNPLIENNTIVENAVGLNIYNENDSDHSPSPTVSDNNIQSNKYNIYLGQQGIFGSAADSIDVSYNWWGTTDVPSINQTIHDYKNDFNLGIVTFTPVLNSSNSQAMPDPNASLPTPATSPLLTSLPSSSVPELNPAVAFLALVVVACAFAVVFRMKELNAA